MPDRQLADLATTLARQAASTAGGLKPGTWESVQALALTSIALNLAARTEER